MTTPENLLVSVCIPTYRGGAFLAAAIDSVLSQTYPHFEIWVLDDNSPDNTQAIVEGYSDARIHYLRNPKNLGPEGNWNRCLEVAQGTYFKLLPHDDLLEADCLQRQVAVLEADTSNEIALVFGARGIIDPQGRTFLTRGLARTGPGRISGTALIRRSVRAGTNVIGEPGNGLVRRALCQEIGGYDATFPYVVDLDYWFRILRHGDAYYTAARTSSFRISKGSWSVEIGDKQHREFMAFADHCAKDPGFGITALDRAIGTVKARINTVGRAVVYRWVLARK